MWSREDKHTPSLLLQECHLRQSKIKDYYFLLCRVTAVTAMIPSTVHAPPVLNTSVDHCFIIEIDDLCIPNFRALGIFIDMY